MNSYQRICLAVAISACLCGPAARVSAEPSSATAKNVFIGNYGEVLRYPTSLEVSAKMRGVMEVVDFHRKTDAHDGARRPRPSLQAFLKEDIAQLIVTPRASSKFRSLGDLRAAKIAEMTKSGIDYRLEAEPAMALGAEAESFAILIGDPPTAMQFYAETPQVRCILTMRPRSAGSAYDRDFGEIRVSLAEFLTSNRDRKTDPPEPPISSGTPATKTPRLKSVTMIVALAVLLIAGGAALRRAP